MIPYIKLNFGLDYIDLGEDQVLLQLLNVSAHLIDLCVSGLDGGVVPEPDETLFELRNHSHHILDRAQRGLLNETPHENAAAQLFLTSVSSKNG
jgi:hypothetical protein